MAILKIKTIPDPVLKAKSLEVTSIDDKIISIAQDMLDTMRHFNNCIGLSAPQVGVNLRLIVFDVSLYPKKFHNHGQIVMLNPVLKKASVSRTGREGCLSVPDFTANITRAEEIDVLGYNLELKEIKFKASGFEAVVIQHEVDHLDGIIFLDRVTSLKTDIFRRKNA